MILGADRCLRNRRYASIRYAAKGCNALFYAPGFLNELGAYWYTGVRP